MSAFNSMSGAGSAIGITADIRLNRAELVSDIAAARQTIQTEFSSMQINFGASLLESVRSVAPEITATIAQAVSAGMAGGGGSFAPVAPGGGGGGLSGPPGVTGGFQSGNYIPSLGFAGMGGTLAYSQGPGVGMPVQYATPGELMADNAAHAAVQQQRIASGKVFQRTGMAAGGMMADAPSMEAIEEAAGSEAAIGAGLMAQERQAAQMAQWKAMGSDDEVGAGVGGMGSMARLFSAFMVIRAARSGEEFFEKSASDDESVFNAENMPGRTNRQRIARDDAEIRAYTEKRSDTEGFWGFARDDWQQGGPIQGYKQYLQQSNLLTSEIGTTQSDLSAAKANENQEDEKRLQLENQIIEARRRGNKAEEEHLQLLEQLTQRQQQMNEAIPGSGTAWFNTTGQAILGDQTAEGIITKMDNAAIRQLGFQKSLDILNKTASGDVRGAERERIEWQQQQEYMKVEENFQTTTKFVPAKAGGDSYAEALAIQNDPDYPENYRDAAKAVVEQKQLMDATMKAYDAGHSGMAFTSGMETWRRMQTAGYGSAPGDNSGARRVYAAGGGSSGGNPLSLGSPSAPNWGSGLAHGGAGGGGSAASGLIGGAPAGLIGSSSPLIHSSMSGGFRDSGRTHPLDASPFGSPDWTSGSAWMSRHGESGISHLMDQRENKYINSITAHAAQQNQSGPGGPQAAHDRTYQSQQQDHAKQHDLVKTIDDLGAAAKQLRDATAKKLIIMGSAAN